MEWDRDNILFTALFIVTGPIGLFAVLAAGVSMMMTERTRRRCNRIMTKWEAAGMQEAKANIDRCTWYGNKETQEERYNSLRETIKCLTNGELDTLSKVDKGTYELDKPLRDAVIDELIHRRLLR